MSRALAAALVLLALAGCAARDPDAGPKAHALDSAQVEARLQRYAYSLRRGDPAGVAALFAPDGRSLAPRQPALTGPAAIDSALQAGAAGPLVAAEVHAETTRAASDSARQAGTWRELRSRGDGTTEETRGRFVVRWARDVSGEWMIRSLERTEEPAR